MTVDIIMPKMGESIMEGTILKWIKKAGDKIERDEPILEISTDKVDTEVPAPESGVLTELLYKEGDVIEVGKVIARMTTVAGADAGALEEVAVAEVEEKVADAVAEAEEKVAVAGLEKESVEGGGFYSPLVLNIAKKEGISFAELEKINGTGQNSRVTKKDLLDYLKNRSSQPSVKSEQPSKAVTALPKKQVELLKQDFNFDEEGLSVLEFDNVRQKMAEHMVASAGISPHVNSFAEVDMSTVEKIRKSMMAEFEEKEGFKLTYMPFICDAVVKALKDFPLVNSVIDDSSVPFKAISRSKINLGMAVAMENGGLIVPVVKEADGKSLVGLARSINDLGKRARVKKLTLDEIQGGTFTISNYGVFGNIAGTMIINQPQVAILGVGAVKKRPTVLETTEGDFVVIKPMMYLTLSFDHRLIDGALGGRFAMRVAHYLENYML
ncbi:MAG: dihydrolipoamide acetyltransferase family protein [Ignavibacteriae bacterium]|nr:dihydrolipoamide acetyltransferase family protein [Ignavibacteriota bacterium]